MSRFLSNFGPFSAAILVSAGLLYAAPLPTPQASLLPIIERLRAEYPTPMAPAQIGALVTRTAAAAGPEWGVLLKPAGSNCPSPVGFISCDILVHIPTEQEFDILGDSDGAGIPTFNKLEFKCGVAPSGCSMARVVRVSAPSEPPAPPTEPPAPVPAPAPTVPVAELLERLEALQREVAALREDVRKPRPIVVDGGWRVGTLRGTLGPPQ